MRSKISSAIATIGHYVTVKYGSEKASLLVSLQPDFTTTPLSDSTGFGTLRRYTLYTAFGEGTPLLTKGSIVLDQGKTYQVETVEDFFCSGVALYRKAALVLTKEEKYG